MFSLPVRIRWAACVGLAATTLASGAHAASAGVPEEGGGWVALAYDYAHMQNHLDPDGKQVDVGSINTQRLVAQVEYGVTEHLAAWVALPYMESRYSGSHPHTMTLPDGTVYVSEIDDGKYHGSFQDVSVGTKYQMSVGSWLVTPLVDYGRPTHQYPTFSHAAIGGDQNRLNVGIAAGRNFSEPLDRFYLEVNYAYSFLEKVAGTTVGKSTGSIEADYFATDRLMLRLYTIGVKTHNGVGPADFRTNPELFEHHEQIQRADSVDVGVGLNYLLTARVSVFGSVVHTTWGENIHEVKYDAQIGVSRAF